MSSLTQTLFYATHVPSTLLLSLQNFIPPAFIPAALKSVLAYWVQLSADPILAPLVYSSAGTTTDGKHILLHEPQRAWVSAILFAECTVGVLGLIWILTKGVDNPRTFPAQIAHAAHTATTTGILLADLYATQLARTTQQNAILVCAYAPYFFVPLWILWRRMTGAASASSTAATTAAATAAKVGKAKKA
ncbi:Transmembrane protein 97 [Geranomyces variabilis]|nr:Transmembrane protein 97 [Geranomyces variabilis]